MHMLFFVDACVGGMTALESFHKNGQQKNPYSSNCGCNNRICKVWSTYLLWRYTQGLSTCWYNMLKLDRANCWPHCLTVNHQGHANESFCNDRHCTHMSNSLNLLHPRKDMAEMVIVFCVSLIVPENLMFAIKPGKHVYQKSSLFVSPLSFLRVSW